jgi:hypothetical protein
MNQHRFVSMLFCTAMVFFLISCGGGGGSEQKSTTDTTSTDTTATTAPAPQAPTSTIDTRSQNMMIAMHKVKDFAKWKTSYDEHDSMRLANGLHSFIVGRGLQDTSMAFVVVKVDDLNKAKTFAKDPNLKKAMQKGGVVGVPTFNYTTMVWQDTGNVGTAMRSRSMFTVKDWDAWKKSFDSTMQLQTDNGLKPRAYGHDANDNHKVILVAAILDSAKAAAFWKSDLLKQRRAASGVVGQPQRFLYRVVQKY